MFLCDGMLVRMVLRVPIRRADIPRRGSRRRAARAACVAGCLCTGPKMLSLMLLVAAVDPAKWTGLVGDVNIFTHDYDEPNNAEIEVMIAEAGHRRRGLAQEAVTVMMSYGTGRCRTFVWVLAVAISGRLLARGDVAAPRYFVDLGFDGPPHAYPRCQQRWRC